METSIVAEVSAENENINVKGGETPQQFEEKIRTHYEKLFEIWKAKHVLEVEEQLDAKCQTLVEEQFNRWVESQKPPSVEDIQKLVSQEYVEFKLTIPDRKRKTRRDFIIVELPQQAEMDFYRQVKSHLIDHRSQLNAMDQKFMDKSFEEQVMEYLEIFDGAFDILADACVVILNPFKEEVDIDRNWVQNNVSSSRQWNIVQAQMECNRLRDFFSKLSQSGQQMESTMTPVKFRNLLAQHRS